MPGLPPLRHTSWKALRKLRSLSTLSLRLNHWFPLTPFSRAVSMRSVQTLGSTQNHFWRRASPACLGVAATPAGICSSGLFISPPSSCVPSLRRSLPAFGTGEERFSPPFQCCLRYYGRSDSPAARLFGPWRHEPRLF